MRPQPKPTPLRRHPPQHQRGVTTLEYIVLGAVLVLGLVAAVSMFKGSVGESLQTEGEALSQVASGSIAGVRDRYGDGAGGPGARTGQTGQALGAGQEPERRVGDGWQSSGPRVKVEFSDTDGDGTTDSARLEGSVASTGRNDEFFGGAVKTEVDGKVFEGNAEAGLRVDDDTLSANFEAERNVASGHANARVGDVLGLEAEALVGHEQVEAHGGAGLYGAGGKFEAEASAVQGKVAYGLGDEVNPFFRSELEGKLVQGGVKGDALYGYDGKRVGVAFGGEAQGSLASGRAGGEYNIPIPFTGLSFQLRSGVSGSAGSVGGGGGGHGYYDTEEDRVHVGSFGGINLGGGFGLDFDVSFGRTPTKRE